MRYLTVDEVLELHRLVVQCSGGLAGIKNRGLIESAAAQPRMTFDGTELYPSLVEKAAALAFSLARNHAFEDGNKRIAHAAMETFLVLNGFEIEAVVDEQERVFLDLAGGRLSREELVTWLRTHTRPRNGSEGTSHGP